MAVIYPACSRCLLGGSSGYVPGITLFPWVPRHFPYVEGLWLTLEAGIQPVLNWAMKLYMDKCVNLNRSQRTYTLVFNWGSVGF